MNKVVIITGAGSGIGKAAVDRLSTEEYVLVLAGRREKALRESAKLTQGKKAHAHIGPIDVSNENHAKGLVNDVVERFGKVDVLVNNASVYCVGKFEKIPENIFRQVIDINLYGYINMIRAVLPHMIEQGNGNIINIVSVDGIIPSPYATPYTTSKFALTGYLKALRSEIKGKNIHVGNIYPSSVNTPLYYYCGNYAGKKIKPMNPVFSPEKVAKEIQKKINRPGGDSIVGWYGKLGVFFHKITPGLIETVFDRQIKKNHFKNVSVMDTSGNILEPAENYMYIRGEWS